LIVKVLIMVVVVVALKSRMGAGGAIVRSEVGCDYYDRYDGDGGAPVTRLREASRRSIIIPTAALNRRAVATAASDFLPTTHAATAGE
jgi:hypothetical protein